MNRKPDRPQYEFDSPHINAPEWPWSFAGWSIAGFLMLLFLRAWLYA